MSKSDEYACTGRIGKYHAETLCKSCLQHTPSPQDDLGLTWVKGLKCPTCGGESLFVGKGGYMTCSYIPCPEPDYEKGLQSYLYTKVNEARIDEVIRNPYYNADAEYGYFVNRLKQLEALKAKEQTL